MARYLIGSKLIGLSNRDNDYIVVDTEFEHKRAVENGEDILYQNIEVTNKILNFDEENPKYRRLWLYNYQYDKDIIGQNFPIEYHLLEHKDKLISLLKRTVEKKLYNFNKRVTVNKSYCTQIIYHIAYNTFIIQNNSPIITNEQKAIIQKIHDIQMPIEYLDELAQIIKSL
jgi:hypothetical protein